MTTGSRRLAILACCALLTATACGSPGRPPNNTMNANPEQQLQEMLTRPDIEQVSRRYEDMRMEIQGRLTSDIGLAPWTEDADSGARSSCRAYPDVDTGDKESRSLPAWYVEANVPDEKWSQTLAIITEIAGKYGFGAPQILVDNPGRHEISMRNGYGAETSFGTRINTSMLILTGCHLTAEAHKRGKPTGRP